MSLAEGPRSQLPGHAFPDTSGANDNSQAIEDLHVEKDENGGFRMLVGIAGGAARPSREGRSSVNECSEVQVDRGVCRPPADADEA